MNLCSGCKKHFLILLKCGRCKQTAYCSKECQTNDWKNHKTVCGGEQGPQKETIIKTTKQADPTLSLYNYFLRVLQTKDSEKYPSVLKAIAAGSHNLEHAQEALSSGVLECLIALLADPLLSTELQKKVAFAISNFSLAPGIERLYCYKYSILDLLLKLAEKNPLYTEDYLQTFLNLTSKREINSTIHSYLNKAHALKHNLTFILQEKSRLDQSCLLLFTKILLNTIDEKEDYKTISSTPGLLDFLKELQDFQYSDGVRDRASTLLEKF